MGFQQYFGLVDFSLLRVFLRVHYKTMQGKQKFQ